MTHYIDLDKMDKIFPGAYFDMSNGCVEPGYDDKPVILADWNHVPDKVFDALESHGFACKWSDEWIQCSNCYKAFRTSPDCYGWEMSGIILDGECLCLECLDPIEYYESLHNKPKNAVTWPIAEKYPPADYGYILVQNEFENGFYPGQNDNPGEILDNALKNDPEGLYLFVIDGQGQFDIEFSLYKKVKENQ